MITLTALVLLLCLAWLATTVWKRVAAISRKNAARAQVAIANSNNVRSIA